MNDKYQEIRARYLKDSADRQHVCSTSIRNNERINMWILDYSRATDQENVAIKNNTDIECFESWATLMIKLKTI